MRGRIFRIDPGEEESVFIPYEEAVFYKVHVRGYTKKKTSGRKLQGNLCRAEREDSIHESTGGNFIGTDAGLRVSGTSAL